jgi:non-ribosomal peptide synthetase component F/aryl carrier-like protein
VEYHLHQSFPNAQGAIAEVVSSTKEDWPPALVAFIALNDKDARNGESSIFDTPNDSFKRSIISATSKLDSVLPVFMVPTIFIPLHQIPLTKTGKTDRRALKIAAASLTREQIEILTCTESIKRLPTTVAEGKFQRLFADIFGFDTLKIGIDDHFFRLGGDSILAMTLISKARDAGYVIDMADVFNHPKLCDLAGSSRSIAAQADLVIAPFSLIRNSSIQEIMIQSAAEQCKVSISQIEDIYPCTPLQEGLVVLAIKTPGQYVTTFEYEIAADIDLHRFQTSWNATVIANPILRTRVLLFESVIFQVVVGEMISWNLYDNQAAYEDGVKALNMGMGESLVDFGVIKTSKDSANGFRFHLTLHHVLYDAHSLGLLWNQVQQAYDNKTLPPRPFNRFIEYISKLETAENFWRSECASLTAPVFPNLQSSRYMPSPTSSLSHVITCLHHTATEFTMSTLIRMAWAIIISSYTDSEDVVYGMTVDGRNAPIPGIEQLITGPTFATFPMRIHVRPGDSVETALSSIQLKTTDMIPFQHSGLQNIRQFGEEAASACSFQFHLGIQAPPVLGESRIFSSAHTRHEDYGAFANYSLVIICHLPVKGEPNDILIVANYDERALEPLEVTRMVHQFEHILRQLSSVQSKNCPLGGLDLLCPEDRKQIEDWNSVLPSSHEACLHDLVLQHSKARPNAPAISSWDGDMTFRELESACHALTQHLEALGIEPQSLVPLCFERSKWSVIAMIAVIQLGAACVCIDPTHPKKRIHEILHRTNAKFILTSPLNQPIMADADVTVVAVPILEGNLTKCKLPRHSISPEDIAFVVFTSGSTGASKAILMEHVNLATSVRDYSSEMQINEQTRGLHFASYAFDASIYEIFGTLVNGGCVCIPSEYDRMNNIDLFINEYEVNWAFLTPSFITSIRPESIPGVRTIVLGGEAVTQENVRNWASRVTLVNGYGPAESTVCAVGRIPITNWKQGTIGRVTGGVGWITMPNDPYRIAPIGAVGELLVEGKMIGEEYTPLFKISHEQ